jgi:lysophospholipid acyltransferase (LPLAT)-like uncharacterized protein
LQIDFAWRENGVSDRNRVDLHRRLFLRSAFMKIRHPWLIRLASLAGAVLVRNLLATLRRRVIVADERLHPAEPIRERFIYAFWHESLLAVASQPAKVNVLISLHADGEIITQICRALGIGVIRGSTTRRGGAAMLEMLHSGRETHLAITPDGPRGPRRNFQVGAVYLASKTGLPIVPIGVGFSRAWRAKSWDRFAIPLPFSTAYGVVGAPIVVPRDLDRAGLETYRLLVERALLAATGAAEKWAASPHTPPQFRGRDVAAAA